VSFGFFQEIFLVQITRLFIDPFVVFLGGSVNFLGDISSIGVSHLVSSVVVDSVFCVVVVVGSGIFTVRSGSNSQESMPLCTSNLFS